MQQKTYIIINRICEFILRYCVGIDKHDCRVDAIFVALLAFVLIVGEVDPFVVSYQFAILCNGLNF